MSSSVITATIVPEQTLTSLKAAAQSEPREAPRQLAGKEDFFWSYTEEPHQSRRHAIIKAHPEILKLCGPEPLTRYIVLGVVILQITCAYLLRNTAIFSWPFLLTAYFIGATANQNLFLAIHELSHNLAFKSPLANRLLAVFANLPVGIPYSASFRPYHLTHHKSLGVDGFDVDIPTTAEAFLLDSIAGKAFFCTFQIFIYALRPMFIYQLPITNLHLFNIAAQVLFDYLLVHYAGGKALAYLIVSSFLSGSLHPCAGHFIAEHYVFSQFNPTLVNKDNNTSSDATQAGGQDNSTHARAAEPLETYSYYGPLNLLTYNVGYHNEHHDFPAVPWSRLPKIREIASEYYADLPYHTSWIYVIWQFVLDENVGLWCRVKRKEGGRKVGCGISD